MRGVRFAVAFLTRIPVTGRDGEGPGLEAASGWFGVVGALIGLAVAGVYALAFGVVPSLLASVLAVGTGVWLTRGLHEDGLADVADSLGSGERGRRALEVMSDPRVGSFGTLALIFSVLWRVMAVATLTPVQATVSLVAAHSLSRSSLVTLMSWTSVAKPDGLAASVAGETSKATAMTSGLSAVVISSLIAGLWAIPAVVGVITVSAGVARLASRRFGGITGDVLGACQQLGEMVVLGVVVTAAWRGWVPWWVR